MDKRYGRKSLNIDLPTTLYNTYAKACIDAGITKTEGLVRYIEYLRAQSNYGRKMLDENTKSDFKLGQGKPR